MKNNNTEYDYRGFSGWTIIKRLGGYMLKHKGYLIVSLLLIIVSDFLVLLAPSFSGKAIDAIHVDTVTRQVNVDFDSVFFYCGLMIAFYLIDSVLSYLLSVVMTHYSQKIKVRLRNDIFNKLLELPVSYFDRLQAGDIISRISYDVDSINDSISSNLVQIINAIITVSGSFYFMLTISPKMLVVFFATIPFSVYYTVRKVKKVRPLARKRSAKLGELNGFTEEMLSGVKTMKAYGREKQFSALYASKNKETTDAVYESSCQYASLGPSVNFINNLSMTLISVAGASFYVAGQITPGNISNFILYSRNFSGQINQFSNIISDLQSCRSASERVFTIIDEYSEKECEGEPIELSEIKGEIVFDHVKFRYTPDREIIHDLCVTAPAGKTVAIVGPTGGGKTTIVNLLMRFYDVQHGQILLDNVPIDRIPRKKLRQSFTMVLQETWLFNGTVAENIAYGTNGATREEIENAAKSAGVHDFIMSLPDGYDTYLSDGGLNISKGQKQLLTIARAMLSDAKILILDEATSNIDTRTEKKIEEAMMKLQKGKTCFVIAHRLSTIRDADVIMVVRDGDVVETGTHKELLKKKGFYSELYFSQYN